MVDPIGFLAAGVAALCWGSQFVPMKKLKNPNPYHYHVFMSIGIFVTSLTIALAVNASIYPNSFGLLSGLFWGLGNVLMITALNRLGLAKGSSLVLGMVILTSFLWGTLFFHEEISNIYLAIGGIVLLLIGLPIISVNDGKKKMDLRGLAAGIASGLIFGGIFVPQKIGGVAAQDFLFPMALGILISAAILFAVKVRKTIKNEIVGGVSSGAIWGVANFAALNAIAVLGLAVGFPLTQLALLISVAWGLMYFREIKERSKILKIVLGAIILIIGGFLLAFSKI